jgi:DNA-directed RNA polymerase II subunit RPB2
MEPFDLLNLYFKSNPLFMTQHHIESYNDFVMRKIPAIIKNLNPFLVIKNTSSGKPVRIEVFAGGILQDPKDAPKIYYEKPVWVRPTEEQSRPLYPNEARLFDRSYVCQLYVDIDIRYSIRDDITIKTFKKVHLGTLPIMLHSCLCNLQHLPIEVVRELGECSYDQGGYFIIDGKEKVIVAQETQRHKHRVCDPKQ